MKKKYTNKGVCIWCGKTEPEVTFYTKPHIIPHSIGGDEIGIDICDSCNNYFGKANKGEPNTNTLFKEVFITMEIFSQTLTPETYKKYPSTYFKYQYSKHCISFKRPLCISTFTKQFKRGLYEVFLQKYHFVTKDGLNPALDTVRKYARFGIGDLKVYYVFNYHFLKCVDNKTFFPMSDKLLEEINEYGYFHFYFLGHSFILEIYPERAKIMFELYIKKITEIAKYNFTGKERIFELKNILEIDFFMNRRNDKTIETNNKLLL